MKLVEEMVEASNPVAYFLLEEGSKKSVIKKKEKNDLIVSTVKNINGFK